MSKRPESVSPDIADQLADIQKHPPVQWENPQTKVIVGLLEQSGILPTIAKKNPEVRARIVEFFTGQKRICIIGGESGMGKSLLVADLRSLHHNLKALLPAEAQRDLAVISWDRTHMSFFEEVSTEAGETIPLPLGETAIQARDLVSKVMADQMHYLLKYHGPQTLILVECPLIDTRGETIFDELGRFSSQIQTFIMHSPKSREQTLNNGRLMATSGQRNAMEAIRQKLLQKILGFYPGNFTVEAQDDVIRRWWLDRLKAWNGTILEWDPDDNLTGYQNSILTYQELGIKPDVITPKGLSRYTKRLIESILQSTVDIEELLKLLLA